MAGIRGKSCTLAGVASMVAVLSGCAEMADTDTTEVTQEPIYYGTVATNLASGVVRLDGYGLCSGTIFSDYWVLTAAHCIPNYDTNGDGEITSAEGAGTISVSPGPNASNQGVSLTARRIFRHPEGTWGSTWGTDTALIWLSDPGFYTSYLSPYNYSAGKLNIDPLSVGDILGYDILAFGYGPDGPGNPSGVLRSGWKRVVDAYLGGYACSTLNNAGTVCPGDSGGPDFRWTGAAWVVTGVHSSGDTTCNGGGDWQLGPDRWRDWVSAKTNTCPDTTSRGICHF